jgi:hypothetical protein
MRSKETAMTKSVRATVVAMGLLQFSALSFAQGLGQGDGKEATTLPSYEIRAAPISIKGLLGLNAGALPKGAGGKFPSFDGDNFLVNLTPRPVAGEVTSQHVLAETIRPLLQAMGYDRLGKEIAPPKGDAAGSRLPLADLARLAAQTCTEVQGADLARFHPVCQAMQSGNADAAAEREFSLAYGATFSQFKADIEGQRIQYVFTQRRQGVPIEHSAIIATRWDGETVTSVHGTLFNSYRVANRVVLTPKRAIAAGQQRLQQLDALAAPLGARGKPDSADLVLLPYGTVRDGAGVETTALRYAYRATLFASRAPAPDLPRENLSWLAWLDAQDGMILQLMPQFAGRRAVGMAWRRDPATLAEPHYFEVDPPANGRFTLSLDGVFYRFDRFGNYSLDDGEVDIADTTRGGHDPANFNQPPLNVAANAVCGMKPNSGFRQVNAYAHLYSFREMLVAAGTIPPFPDAAINVIIDRDPFGIGDFALYDDGTGHSRLTFAADNNILDSPLCPDPPSGWLPGAEDATTLAHEMAHLSTIRLQQQRPSEWCASAPCPVPGPARRAFHDFADAWAEAYASTPCQGGWEFKNIGGPNWVKGCLHDDPDLPPRLSAVAEPFDPAVPPYHFPERRQRLANSDYDDGEIASTALWLTREGMRSKSLASGTAQYWVRINRALYDFGMIASTCMGCDRDIYRGLQDLLRHMTHQWATAGLHAGPPASVHDGAHTTNKLLSAWARTGVFLIPSECLDGDPSTGNPSFCPIALKGENGGDALVDVDDNDPGDDPVIDGVTHPETDYIKRGAAPPTFRVWTGPRYRFDAQGHADPLTPSAKRPAPCNAQFEVEIASDAAFTLNRFTSTAGTWKQVSRVAVPECYGRWAPQASDWATVAGTAGDVRVYYRLRTRDAAGGNEKISTSPGSGSYTVPAGYVIVNAMGQP